MNDVYRRGLLAVAQAVVVFYTWHNGIRIISASNLLRLHQRPGGVKVMRWPTRELRELRERNPASWTRIQSVIGHGPIAKVRLWESRTRASA